MPKSLKLYVASVVVIGALALVAATYLFPPKSAIAIGSRARRRPIRAGIRARHPVLDGPDVSLAPHSRFNYPVVRSKRHRGCADHGFLLPWRSRCWRLGCGARHDGTPRTPGANPLVRLACQSRRLVIPAISAGSLREFILSVGSGRRLGHFGLCGRDARGRVIHRVEPRVGWPSSCCLRTGPVSRKTPAR